MNDESDDALVYYIVEKESDPRIAQQAFKVFYERHCPIVFRALRRLSVSHPVFAIEDAEEVTEDVFRKLWSGAAEKCDLNGIPIDRQSTVVCAWLLKIAMNLVHDFERRSFADGVGEVHNEEFWQKVTDTRTDDPATLVQRKLDHESEPPPKSDEEVQFMTRILESLPQIDRDILLIWAGKFDASTGKKEKLTPSELAAWCKQLGITAETFHQKRSRAFKRIKTEFDAFRSAKKIAG